MSRWQVGTLDIFPDGEALVVSWLKKNMTGVNIRTETDTTFGTPNPAPSMTLPLVRVSVVTAGMGDRSSLQTKTSNVDVECFAGNSTPQARDARANAWALYHQVHAWMMRAIGQTTSVGTFDDVYLHDELGIVPDSNPNLRRVIATYGIATRAESAL